MARGGYREKAGRKSTWVSGCKFEETKLIRVPIAISDRVLEIAHKLDSNESIDLVTESNNEIVTESEDKKYSLSELIEKGKQIVYDVTQVRIKDRASVRKYFSLLLDVDRESFK
jgi:predicted kinase